MMNKRWIVGIIVSALCMCANVIHAEEETHKETRRIETRKHDFTYFKLGGAFVNEGKNYKIGPFLGAGMRFERASAAIDISMNWSRSAERHMYYSIPRALYLRYLQPKKRFSPYLGGGLSLAGVTGRQGHRFHGLFGDVAIGAEFDRHRTVRLFAQLDIAQPLMSYSRKGDFPAPTIGFSAGFGF